MHTRFFAVSMLAAMSCSDPDNLAVGDTDVLTIVTPLDTEAADSDYMAYESDIYRDTDIALGPPPLEPCPPGTRRTGLTWADATWIANSDLIGNDVMYLQWNVTAGDLNGDGYQDLAFLADHVPTGAYRDPYFNVVFARLGPFFPGRETPDPTVLAIQRAAGRDAFGISLAVADLDGDGRDEIGVGNREAIHVLTFNDFATGFTERGLRTEEGDTLFGESVCAVADPTNPGVENFIGGAPHTSTPPSDQGLYMGAIWRVDGIPSTWVTLDSSTVGWRGSERRARAGVSVAVAGDRDGDGIDEVLVGGTSLAWLVSGANLRPGGGTGVLATFAADRATLDDAVVEAAGDVDGDGMRDLVISLLGQNHEPCDSAMPEGDTDCDSFHAGKPYALVWRITGNPRGEVTLRREDALVSYGRLHGTVGRTADAGDLDGDGDREVLIPIAQRRGDAVLLFDDDAPTTPERLFEGWAYVAQIADLTGDGRPDLVVFGKEDGSEPFTFEGDIGIFELCPAP